jgi:NAD-dependent SIR2 family protein deacetylase
MYDHEITCSECGTRHGLRKVSIPVRDKDSIDCLKCGNKDIFRWNEAKIWFAEIINNDNITQEKIH